MNARTEQTFLAVTEARAYALPGERPLYTAGFLTWISCHCNMISRESRDAIRAIE